MYTKRQSWRFTDIEEKFSFKQEQYGTEMAGNEEHDPQDSLESNSSSSSFLWDESSQLYYHASTGFYHDPIAGWYYSSRDGLYYKFENGSYVLLDSVEHPESDACESPRMVSDACIQNQESTKFKACRSMETVSDKSIQDGQQCRAECSNGDLSENPPRPSEWLEETLIDLYLAGYSKSATVAEETMSALETDRSANENCIKLADESCLEEFSHHDRAFEEIEEGEWIPDDMQDGPSSSGTNPVEDASWEEENWREQYGQVMKSEDESLPAFSAVDLWDWTIVTESVGKRKRQVSRLIGRLVRRSAKLHPSMPAGGGLLKTAPICDAHLDLVRVRSGQIFKLRTPSARYLVSLSTYDSSNPTKGWGLPDLFVNMHSISHSDFGANHESETSAGVTVCKDSGKEKHKTHPYRDRAAERRTLHGGFGIGPGQRNFRYDDSSEAADAEEAATEAIEMSFGAGSYGRRLLENMGWKEGTALGNNRNGLIEPLQAVGNKGNAGLGWNHRDS